MFIESDSEKGLLVAASDWLTLPGDELLKRTTSAFLGPPKHEGSNVRELRRNSAIVGRACILPGDVKGTVTIGGLRSPMAVNVAGVLTGESVRTSREQADLFVTEDELARWASEQAALVPNLITDQEGRAECARLIGFLGGDVGELPIVKIRENWLNSTQVAEWVRDKRSLLVITPSTLNDALRKNYGSALLHNVFVEPHTPGGIQHYSFHHLFRSEFQAHLSERRTKHASSPLLRAVAKGWSIGVDQVDVWTVEFDIGARDTVLVDAKQIRHPECDEE